MKPEELYASTLILNKRGMISTEVDGFFAHNIIIATGLSVNNRNPLPPMSVRKTPLLLG